LLVIVDILLAFSYLGKYLIINKTYQINGKKRLVFSRKIKLNYTHTRARAHTHTHTHTHTHARTRARAHKLTN